MKKNARFYHSFINAFRGIVRTLRTERNFRIHIAVAVVVITLACFYGLDQTGWLFLVAAITSVLAAELLNTSIENACDAQTDEYNENQICEGRGGGRRTFGGGGSRRRGDLSVW